MQTEIFFIISSVGFIVLFILIAIALAYILYALRLFSSILKKVEKDIYTIGDTTKEMLEEMRESAVFRFLFGRKKIKNKD